MQYALVSVSAQGGELPGTMPALASFDASAIVAMPFTLKATRTPCWVPSVAMGPVPNLMGPATSLHVLAPASTNTAGGLDAVCEALGGGGVLVVGVGAELAMGVGAASGWTAGGSLQLTHNAKEAKIAEVFTP
jgi:hypothetical protein